LDNSVRILGDFTDGAALLPPSVRNLACFADALRQIMQPGIKDIQKKATTIR